MILDSFYLLFKSNATQARTDIKQLDEQIAQLAAKGKKQDDEESKRLDNLRKQRRALKQDLKDITGEMDKLGDSFTRVIEAGVGALTAYVSFGAIKTGILDAAKLNSTLAVQAKITGQNAGELKAYATAVEAAGGSAEGFLSSISAMTSQAAAAGLPLTNISQLLRYIHNQLENQPKQEQRRILGLYGITDPGEIALLEQGNAEFEQSIADIQKHADATNKAAPAAREFQKQLSKTYQTFQDVFSVIGEDVLPSLTSFLKSMENIGSYLTGHEHLAEGFFLVTAGAATIAATQIVSAGLALLRFLGILSAVVPAATTAAGGVGALGVAGLAAVGGAAGATALGGIRALGDVGNIIYLDSQLDKNSGAGHRVYDPKTKKWSIPGQKRYDSTVGRSAAEQESFNFWISQGYSAAQAAGLVANEQAESNFNPGARGDSGLGVGSFQWHPDRQQSILANTGIDVRTAGHTDQLRAAAWELMNSGVTTLLKQVQSADEAGALVSQRFERPRDSVVEAIKRGQLAAQIAQSHFSDAASVPASFATTSSQQPVIAGQKTITVKTGDITVQTQATDSAGIARGLGDALARELQNAIASFDDGVSA